MRDALDEAVPRLWRGLPVLLLATLPWACAAVLTGAVYLGGALWFVPPVVAAALGPAWQLLSDACAAMLRDEPVRLRRMAGAALRRGAARATPVAVAALLVVANLHAGTAPAWLRLSLAVNLVAFGCAFLVAPFAFAAPVRGTVAAWRYGAGVAAASPAYVAVLLVFLAVAGGIAVAIGPPVLYLVPAVVAMCTAAVTRGVPAGLVRARRAHGVVGRLRGHRGRADGVDTRATREIEELTQRYGAGEILRRCGSLPRAWPRRGSRGRARSWGR